MDVTATRVYAQYRAHTSKSCENCVFVQNNFVLWMKSAPFLHRGFWMRVYVDTLCNDTVPAKEIVVASWPAKCCITDAADSVVYVAYAEEKITYWNPHKSVILWPAVSTIMCCTATQVLPQRPAGAKVVLAGVHRRGAQSNSIHSACFVFHCIDDACRFVAVL